MKLFKRHPMVPWRPKVDEQIIPTDIQANNPAFAKDFAFLNTELVKYFQVLDNEALQGQNQFRLDQIILIVGSALATVLGAIQAAFLSSAWFGGGETVLTIILAGVALRSRALKAQERYFTNRLK